MSHEFRAVFRTFFDVTYRTQQLDVGRPITAPSYKRDDVVYVKVRSFEFYPTAGASALLDFEYLLNVSG